TLRLFFFGSAAPFLSAGPCRGRRLGCGEGQATDSGGETGDRGAPPCRGRSEGWSRNIRVRGGQTPTRLNSSPRDFAWDRRRRSGGRGREPPMRRKGVSGCHVR